jgi:hypothetical protein
MSGRTVQILGLLVALGASLAWAVTEIHHRSAGGDVVALRHPATMPATQPAVAGAAGPGGLLPPEYAILQTQNAFGRGHASKAQHGMGGPEATFVFKGAVQAGEMFTAFVEDVSANRVMQLAIGDSVARGKIKSIDLDTIEYDVSGKSRQIALGQNLNGEAVAPTSQPSAPAPAAAPGPTDGMPPGMVLPPGMSPADVAAMMQQAANARRRR